MFTSFVLPLPDAPALLAAGLVLVGLMLGCLAVGYLRAGRRRATAEIQIAQDATLRVEACGAEPRTRAPALAHRVPLPLLLLCAAQSCERFAFFAMLPLFVLYLHRRHGISEPVALLVLGVFQAFSYVGGLPAGWLADKKIGPMAAALVGAACLALGYGALALDHPALLWPALGLMVFGHSFFKPSLHVLIGGVSNDEAQRERVFLWHYLAINIGCLAGPSFAEWAQGQHGGWSILFGCASAVSAIGVLALTLSGRWLRIDRQHSGAARHPHPQGPSSMPAVWIICAVAVVFWMAMQQAGSSLMLFASENTVLQGRVLNQMIRVGPGHFSSLHALLVLLMLPFFLWLSARRHASSPTSMASKMIWGYVVMAAAFAVLTMAGLSGGDSGRVSPAWLVGCYMLLSLAEMLLAPLSVSLLTQLAPKDRAAQAVGLWFAATAAGNVLAGGLGLLWGSWLHHQYFALLALASLVAGAVLLLGLPDVDQIIARRTVAALQPDAKMEAISAGPEPGPALRHADLWTASLAILLPVPLMVADGLPMPLRAASAILCGTAALLCGSYLAACAIDSWVASPASRNAEADAAS